MKPHCFVLTTFIVASALAQERPGGSTNAPPRRQGSPPVVSPDVQADRRVTFRVRAPKASEVSVSGEWPGGTKALTNEGNGVWSVTVGPLEPDLYGYGFSVDGLRIADPGNPNVKPMRSPTTSILDVPGDKPLLHDFQASVPHGTVRQHWYWSKSLNHRRSLHVYTPPGYDNNRGRYPTLYLFHGSGDNDATWTALGRAHLIFDNLLSQGRAKPMVVVMTDGHAVGLQVTGGVGTNLINRNVEAFQTDLLSDVMPFVEANYRVERDAAHRAIVGLSMGGGQSLTIGLGHPELFAWVGGFSSYLPNPEQTLTRALAGSKDLNKQLRLLWFACGKDDRFVENARQLSVALKQKEIKHEFRETEGNHSWPVWRRYLVEFAPQLFAK